MTDQDEEQKGPPVAAASSTAAAAVTRQSSAPRSSLSSLASPHPSPPHAKTKEVQANKKQRGETKRSLGDEFTASAKDSGGGATAVDASPRQTSSSTHL
jgi:hypothetical protein